MTNKQVERLVGGGYYFEDSAIWSDISRETMLHYALITAGRFGESMNERRLESFKIRTTRNKIELVSKDNLKGYVFVETPEQSNQDFRRDFAFIKKEYATLGTFIRREFVFEDLRQAGFMWETQR